MELQKTLNCQTNLEEKRTKLEVSHSLISHYTTKLQSSKQHGTGTKTDTHRSRELNRDPRNKLTHLWFN